MKVIILTPVRGPAPCKEYGLKNGKLIEHKHATTLHWKHETRPFRGIRDFQQALKLELSKKSVIAIRGTPGETDTHPTQRGGWVVTVFYDSMLRRSSNYPDKGCDWLMMDVDGVILPKHISPYSRAAVRWFIKKYLPKDFQNVTCAVSFSGSAGVIDPATGEPVKPGLRVHLIFALSKPIFNQQAKTWLHGCRVDMALYTPVQPHFIMDPIIGEGIECKVKKRHILLEGESDVVQVPEIIADIPIQLTTEYTGETDWLDPSVGLPTQEQAMTCDFMRWFVTDPSRGTGRYPPARAFATNAYRTSGDAVEFVTQGLNANRPEGYVHTDQILQSLPESRPISCRVIYEDYKCPNFDERNQTCKRSTLVRTPYGLARYYMTGGRK